MLHDSAPVVVLAQNATVGLLGDVPLLNLDLDTWQHQPLSNPRGPGPDRPASGLRDLHLRAPLASPKA